MTNFKIESQKRIEVIPFDEEDETVSEAIETIYSSYKPDVKIKYKEYVLHLSKKGDISDIFDGIVGIIIKIKSNESNIIHNFLTSSFTAKVGIKVEKEYLKIKPKWYVANITKNKERIQNDKFSSIEKEIKVSKNDFINQWNLLLHELKRDLLISGYSNSLMGFEYLNTIVEQR